MRGPAHSGLGLLGTSNPIWGLGASMYWTAHAPMMVQIQGGRGIATLHQGGGTDPYWVFDRGKGKFIAFTFASPSPPLDGYFGERFANVYNDTFDASRSFTAEGGLTVTTPALPDSYIADTSTSLPGGYRVENASGVEKRIYRLETASATDERLWTVLARRTDGGVIDATVLDLFIATSADPLGVDIKVEGTFFSRLRADGWYVLWCVVPTSGSSLYYGVNIADGYTIDFEAPGIATPFSTALFAPSHPIPTGAAGTFDGPDQVVTLRRTTGLNETYPRCGFIAASLTMRWAIDEPYDHVGAEIPWPEAYFVNWPGDASNNKIALFLSQAQQAVTAWMRRAATSEVFIAGIPTWGSKERFGVVLTWGYRRGSQYAVMTVNGRQVGVDTSWQTPAGAPTEIVVAGNQSTDLADPANAYVEAVVVGRTALTRLDARHLSQWLQRQASGALL